MNREQEKKLIVAIGKEWIDKDDYPEGHSFQNEDYDNAFYDNGGWEEWAWSVVEGETRDYGDHFVTLITEVSGGEGNNGNEVFIVIDVDGTLYKMSGTYYSHVGTEWDDGWREVKAVVKPVTFYEGV